MSNKLLTVVIASYNVEKVLKRCLDSLIVEPYLMENVQVLIINDGSKDKTLEIAQKFETKYPSYFYTIDKDNGNYGSVMNKALSIAEGRYFRTLDADDWYESEEYSKFIRILRDTNADLIITERYDHNEGTGVVEHLTINDLPISVDLPAKMISDNLNKLGGCLNVQNFTYKTTLLRECGLKWLEGIYYTDTMFDIWPLPLVKTIRLEKLPVYSYLIGTKEQSMNQKNMRMNYQDFVTVAKAIVKYVNEKYDEKLPCAQMMYYFLYQITVFVYGDIWRGDENMNYIREIHGMLTITSLKRKLEKLHSYHGTNFLIDLDTKSSLSWEFRFFRGVRQILYNLLPYRSNV